MEIKTSELTGKALDYAVAVCESIDFKQRRSIHGTFIYKPSSDLSQGWPIAERERIQVSPHGNDACATYIGSNTYYYGETYLQASMRCYVASKLGNVVEIPDELV